jgi:hypothetical protein
MEESHMRGGAAAIGHRVGDQQAAGDRDGIPAELTTDFRSEPMLHAKHGQEVAELDELGLELDHKEDPGAVVPAQEIDHAALTELRKRDLRSYLPARHRTDPTDDELSECRVSTVHHPIDVDGTRPRLRLDANLENCGNLPNEVQRQLAEASTLDT